MDKQREVMLDVSTQLYKDYQIRNKVVSQKFGIYKTTGIYSIVFGYIYCK